MTARDGYSVKRAKGEIALEFYDDADIPKNIEEPTKIDEQTFYDIIYLMKKTDAVKKGLELLAYSQNTKSALYQKLVQRGFARDVSRDAVDYISSCGHINEYDMACSLVYDMANRRLYGKVRIKAELLSKGFPADVSDRAIADSDADFSDICERRIEKLGGHEIFNEKTSRAKAIAALMRYGFSFDEIKLAMRKK